MSALTLKHNQHDHRQRPTERLAPDNGDIALDRACLTQTPYASIAGGGREPDCLG